MKYLSAKNVLKTVFLLLKVVKKGQLKIVNYFEKPVCGKYKVLLNYYY